MRIFIPSTLTTLIGLNTSEIFIPRMRYGFAVTSSVREEYTADDEEELLNIPFLDAALASVRLLSHELDDIQNKNFMRRVVVTAEVPEKFLTPKSDLAASLVIVDIDLKKDDLIAVHVDTEDAIDDVIKACEVIDMADLGDEDAELIVQDAQDHDLAWYAISEVPYLIELL